MWIWATGADIHRQLERCLKISGPASASDRRAETAGGVGFHAPERRGSRARLAPRV